MTRIGIVVAMAAECRSLTARRIAEGDCLSLQDGCLLTLSGAGPKAAERAVARLVDSGASALISWGCAAALDPTLRPGDLLLPGRILGEDGSAMATETGWRDRLAARLEDRVNLYHGDLAESSGIVATASAKQSIFEATGAWGLDMESAAAARATRRHRLPFLAIRSIVDPAGVSIPPSVQSAFDENGVLQVPKMLGQALLRPGDFLGIIQLGRHFSASLKTLSKTAATAREYGFAVAENGAA
ncbi:MAG: phosphorylase [Methylococcaceae bacterium]|nr:phosphorylase [Methylococcaceae bacterium]